jgi:Domain of unknown function (DUF222)
MFTEELAAARSALEAVATGFDSSCSGREAIALMEQLGAIRRLTDGVTARVAKRIADTDAHVVHGDRSASALCARIVGVGSGEARRAIDNATKLEGLPETASAVREGRLSARAAELIASAAVHDPSAEVELIEIAAEGLAPLLEACIAVRARVEDPVQRAMRQHAARSLHMWKNVDGMIEAHLRLTPEVGGWVKTHLETHARRLFRAARGGRAGEPIHACAADAFAELVLGEAAGVGPAGSTTHIVIDHEALVRGNALPGETCEIPGVGPVNVEWVRHLLGEAFVTAIIKHGKDITTVAHLGRHIPAELRTAMIVSGRECSVQGCAGREYLELDHCEIDHAKGGPTARWNLAWLCSTHHRRKTQGWLLGPPDSATGKRHLDPPGTSRAA